MNKILFDMSNLVHRHYYSLEFRMKKTPEKQEVIRDCFNAIEKLKRKYSLLQNQVICVFDNTEKNWRHEIIEKSESEKKLEYKGTRNKNRENIFEIIEDIKQILGKTKFLSLQEGKFEADDIIHIYQKNNPNEKILLVSSDQDFYQLLKNENLTILDQKKQKEISKKDLNPILELIIKIITGDKSDNIPNITPLYKDKNGKEIRINMGDKTLRKHFSEKNINFNKFIEDEQTRKDFFMEYAKRILKKTENIPINEIIEKFELNWKSNNKIINMDEIPDKYKNQISTMIIQQTQSNNSKNININNIIDLFKTYKLFDISKKYELDKISYIKEKENNKDMEENIDLK